MDSSSDDALVALRRLPVVCTFISSCSNVFLPFLVGIMLSCLGLGAVLCLSIDFCRRYSETRFSQHRALVLAVLALTLTQTGVDCSRIVKIFGDGFGDFAGFLQTRPEDSISPLIGTILQTQTQLYFLIKAWRLCSRTCPGGWHRYARYICASFTTSNIALAFAAGIAMSVEIGLVGNLYSLVDTFSTSTRDSRRFQILIPIHFCASTSADVILSSVIVRQLLVTRNRFNRHARIRTTNERITWLSRLVIQSGAIITALQIATLAMWYGLALPKANHAGAYAYLPMFALPRVCSCAFLLAFGATRMPTHTAPTTPAAPAQSLQSHAVGAESSSPWLNARAPAALLPPPPAFGLCPPEMMRVADWGLLRKSEDGLVDEKPEV